MRNREINKSRELKEEEGEEIERKRAGERIF